MAFEDFKQPRSFDVSENFGLGQREGYLIFGKAFIGMQIARFLDFYSSAPKLVVIADEYAMDDMYFRCFLPKLGCVLTGGARVIGGTRKGRQEPSHLLTDLRERQSMGDGFVGALLKKQIDIRNDTRTEGIHFDQRYHWGSIAVTEAMATITITDEQPPVPIVD